MPAENLNEVFKALSPEPLTTAEELERFYVAELNQVRGDDTVKRLALQLTHCRGNGWFKRFLLGHPGVGKSTELSRLGLQPAVAPHFSLLRLSASSELTPEAFKPFDLLLLIATRLVEATAQPPERGGAGRRPSDRLLERLWGWFAKESDTLTEATRLGGELAAQAGVAADSWWGKILGLSASLRGEMRYAAERQKRVEEYRLVRISELIGLTNAILDECNALLREATGREWLIVGDDFEKPAIPETQVKALFVENANLFQELRAHLIFTLPVAIAYSELAARLPMPKEIIPDTPVYTPDHRPDPRGRQALEAVVGLRLSPQLFEQGQLTRLAVASGGNLRDLFALVERAATNALLDEREKIGAAHADGAVGHLRQEYRRRLGQNAVDGEKITYEEKAARLLAVYGGDPNAEIHDPVNHALLRARALQEFNGRGWLGVHPLVVDLLAQQGRLSGDPVPGGTV